MYDLAIIGGGPAGLTAGLYGGRANLKTIIIEKGLYGGQMQNTLEIENYPGFKNIGGADLSEHMYNQALTVGCEWKYGEVTKVNLEGQPKTLEVGGEVIEARAVIIASGAQPRKLNVPGEKELAGRGVSYCATCDGAFYEDLDVVVVGGGDSAVEEGLFLTRYCSSVTVIHRRDVLRAQAILQERAFKNPKMKFIFNSEVQEIQGEGRVTGVLVRNNQDGSEQVIPCAGVFIYVGFFPNTDFLKGTGILDEWGYVVTGADMKTLFQGCSRRDVRNTPPADRSRPAMAPSRPCRPITIWKTSKYYLEYFLPPQPILGQKAVGGIFMHPLRKGASGTFLAALILCTLLSPQAAGESPLLRRGMRGVEVAALQERLVELGFELAVDGIFGPETEGAVKKLQEVLGLDPDGIVGPVTSAALDALGELVVAYTVRG